MAKYYVQSGNVRMVVDADEADKAALWVIHRTMQQVVPVYEEDELTPQEKSELGVLQGIMVLGNTLHISEIGFDRPDAAQFDTFELLVEWNQLMVALDRLASMLE
ncbi:MAG: hypothetical protein KatS3mg111_4208 [Pirellulaceae bacterium]|nr:MAG: hypothetical protein KatS3mg111_4208 [Pirellulaceae bacterium]